MQKNAPRIKSEYSAKIFRQRLHIPADMSV